MAETTGCAHCPRPADVDLADEDGPHPMCLQCFSAFLLGVVRHDVRGDLLVTTPAAPALATAVA